MEPYMERHQLRDWMAIELDDARLLGLSHRAVEYLFEVRKDIPGDDRLILAVAPKLLGGKMPSEHSLMFGDGMDRIARIIFNGADMARYGHLQNAARHYPFRIKQQFPVYEVVKLFEWLVIYALLTKKYAAFDQLMAAYGREMNGEYFVAMRKGLTRSEEGFDPWEVSDELANHLFDYVDSDAECSFDWWHRLTISDHPEEPVDI